MRLALLLGFIVLSSPSVSVAKPKQKVYHVCSPRDSPELVLSCALYEEARGEGFKGMWAVGNVIINRKNHDKYPGKIRKVVYQKGQFTYTKKKVIKVYDKDSWDQAKKASKTLIMLNNNFPDLRCFTDPTQGSIYFYRRGHEPSWMKKNFKKKLTHKRHVFYGD